MQRSNSKNIGWVAVLVVLLVQLYSRYLPSPWAVFAADDWSNFARSGFYASHMEAMLRWVWDTNRPLSMVAVEVGYRLLGDNMLSWTLLSVGANSLLLLLLLKMAFELTGRRGVAVITALTFALLPNLTETYHWSTQVLNEVACALVPYALSGWIWVAYLRRGGGWRLSLSALAYGAALFSYEAGIFLPAAYVFLLPWRRETVKSMMRLAPFGLVVLLYGLWRVTDAFGMNVASGYPSHMQPGLSLWGVSWNVRQIIHWWAGDNLAGAMLAGFKSFATLSPWTRRVLVLGNVVVVLSVGWWLHRMQKSDPKPLDKTPFPPISVLFFAIAWVGACFAISLVSYTAPRLNVLPAMGISVLVALALHRLPLQKWMPLLILPAVLALTANQGTATSWKDAGTAHMRLFETLQRDQDLWSQRDVLLLDTSGVRQRLTRGLLNANSSHETTWAFYHNALLIRGYVPISMAEYSLGTQQLPCQVVHDVEYGAWVEDDRLIWHGRYDSSVTYTTSMDRVYTVDLMDVIQSGIDR